MWSGTKRGEREYTYEIESISRLVKVILNDDFIGRHYHQMSIRCKP